MLSVDKTAILDCGPPSLQDCRVAGLGMGDVVPLKRQTVVDRLRRRLGLYRKNHNAVLPRYEKSAEALYEKQRQETLRLKQRFLESKAKKQKNNKSDHHHRSLATRENTQDTHKLVPASKASTKRTVDGTPVNSASLPCLVSKEDPAKANNSAKRSDNKPFENKPNVPQTENANSVPTPNFPVSIVHQFSNGPSTLPQTLQNVATDANPPDQFNIQICQNHRQESTNDSRTETPSSSSVECKREKSPGLCQFKTTTASTDRLSDTFPSIGFAEDSGDDVIHPDILKDLIDDVFTNSADIMKDFNFEDSVGSVKDVEKNEINDLVNKVSKPLPTFQNDNLLFVSADHSMNQQQPAKNALFESSASATAIACGLPAMTTASTATPVSSASLYVSQQQRLSQFSGNNLGLGLDFKLTEPSPAALTLKQMAEQHQNMQKKQQQFGNIQLHDGRTQFNMDNFSDPSFRTRFIGTPSTPGSHMKSPNPSIYNSVSFENSFPPPVYDNGFPGTVPIEMPYNKQPVVNGIPVIRQPVLEAAPTNQKQQTNRPMPKRKQTGYAARPRMIFSPDNMPQQTNPNLETRPIRNTAPDVRLQMNQSEHGTIVNNPRQMHQVQTSSTDSKQHEAMTTSYANMFNTFAQNEGNSTLYQMPLPQDQQPNNNYPPNFNSPLRTHEYKISQPLNIVGPSPNQVQSPPYNQHSFMPQGQQASRVAMNPTGNTHWNHQQQQPHQSMDMYQIQGFGQFCAGIPMGIPHSELHQPYRTLMSPSIPRANTLPPNQVGMQQKPHANVQQRPVLHVMNTVQQPITSSDASQSMGLVYGQQDGSQIVNSLDFFDGMDGSASDLLNFGQVMEGTGNPFPILEDMQMLGK